MTTQEFIEKKLKGETRKDSCSSVFAMTSGDGTTVIFSYGTHYPLARIIQGKAFINNRGYSNTTAKHIHWANRACANIVGYDNVYNVPLTDGDALSMTGITNSASREYARVTEEMKKKKRTDTWVYKDLQNTEVRMIQALLAVKELA